MTRSTTKAFLTGALFLGLALIFGSLSSAQPGPPVDLPPVPFDTESAVGVATGAGGTGVATFVFAEGIEPWSTLIVRAGTPDGVDRVTVTFSMETRTVSIQLEDEVQTNTVTVLVSKDFVTTQIGSPEDGLSIEVSEAVNYLGVNVSEDAGGAEVFVFEVTHFSIQSIAILPTALDGGFLGAGGLTALGWAVIGVAVVVIVIASVVALRKKF